MQAPGKQQTSPDDIRAANGSLHSENVHIHTHYLKRMEEIKPKPPNGVQQDPEDRLPPDPLHVKVHPTLALQRPSWTPCKLHRECTSLFPLLLEKLPASLESGNTGQGNSPGRTRKQHVSTAQSGRWDCWMLFNPPACAGSTHSSLCSSSGQTHRDPPQQLLEKSYKASLSEDTGNMARRQ